jgi:hypothetical protein
MKPSGGNVAKKSNQVRWIIALGIVVLLGILIHSTFQATHSEYEVCMAFKGSSHCASATGATQSEAIRSAQTIDCQMLANGRDETMVCLDSPLASVRELKK